VAREVFPPQRLSNILLLPEAAGVLVVIRLAVAVLAVLEPQLGFLSLLQQVIQ
jgi:hypothetical protein